MVKYRPHRGSLDEAMRLYIEFDTKENMTESLVDYVTTYTDDLLPHLTIKKIWYEED